jgi:hypothetical protein
MSFHLRTSQPGQEGSRARGDSRRPRASTSPGGGDRASKTSGGAGALRPVGLPWSDVAGASEPELSLQLRAAVEILHAVHAYHSATTHDSPVRRWGGLTPPWCVVTREGTAVLSSPPLSPDGGVAWRNYIAPEVLAGAEPSEQADIYAVGVMLYEALTGHRFQSEEIARDESHQVHALVQASGVNGCSWELELLGVATKATKLAPSDRWQSARTFADKVAAVAGSHVASRAALGRVVVEATAHRAPTRGVPRPISRPGRSGDTLVGWGPPVVAAPAATVARAVTTASERGGTVTAADAELKRAAQPPAESVSEGHDDGPSAASPESKPSAASPESEPPAVSHESEPVALSVSQPPQGPDSIPTVPPPFVDDSPVELPMSRSRGGRLLFAVAAVLSAILFGYWAGRSESATADQAAGPVAETPMQFKPGRQDEGAPPVQSARAPTEAPALAAPSARAAEPGDDGGIPTAPCSTCIEESPRPGPVVTPRDSPSVRHRIAPRPRPTARQPRRSAREQEEPDYGI